MARGWKTSWGSYWIHVIARVRCGVPAELTNAHANAIYRGGRAAEEARNGQPRDTEQVRIDPWKLGARLFSLFGGLAVAIAALGLYAAISYSVTRRRHEFGVRRALGAQIADVVRLVLGQGVRATAVGVGVGILAALASARFIRDLLFETSPRSPVVLAAVAAAMLAVAIAATLIPAWRASRVDPVTALRVD